MFSSTFIKYMENIVNFSDILLIPSSIILGFVSTNFFYPAYG